MYADIPVAQVVSSQAANETESKNRLRRDPSPHTSSTLSLSGLKTSFKPDEDKLELDEETEVAIVWPGYNYISVLRSN